MNLGTSLSALQEGMTSVCLELEQQCGSFGACLLSVWFGSMDKAWRAWAPVQLNAELMVLHCITGAWDSLHLCLVYGGGVQKRTSRKYGWCDLLCKRHLPAAGIPRRSLCGGVRRLGNHLWWMDCDGFCDHLHSLLLQCVVAGPARVEKFPSSQRCCE